MVSIKWFSDHDESRFFPTPISCYRLEKPHGVSWREWNSWFKLAQLLSDL